MLDALLHLERGKAKGRAMSLDGKTVLNPQGKGMMALGIKDPGFQRQARYCSRRGAPNTKEISTPALGAHASFHFREASGVN